MERPSWDQEQQKQSRQKQGELNRAPRSDFGSHEAFPWYVDSWPSGEKKRWLPSQEFDLHDLARTESMREKRFERTSSLNWSCKSDALFGSVG